MNLYGDWLYDRRDFEEAAMAFDLACSYPKAMQAYEKAHAWRPLFNLALEHDLGEEKIKELGYKVAGKGDKLYSSCILVSDSFV
ncbi:hypothetical protein FRC19_003615 [Serendipita sp. 401]|nr:hypothetical protein FRC19_003615 [Serendipita sp. 401]